MGYGIYRLMQDVSTPATIDTVDSAPTGNDTVLTQPQMQGRVKTVNQIHVAI